MGLSKSQMFTEGQNRIANLAKAIGHPARVAIIEYLLRQKSCICKDIVGEIPLSQPTISQHLRELKNVGFIQGNIEGNKVCYCLNPNTFIEIAQYFKSIIKDAGENEKC